MCGILGSINIINTEIYSDTIKHRGPDAFGVQSFEIAENKIDLLHRRLAILDLSAAGSQPMFSYSNKKCIVFNGEIYNHLDLKTKLKKINFRGHSDTETIVNFFEKYEITKCLKDLNGIFSFAYLDCEKQLLYLARDRFGVKPLYYWFQYNQLLFASEIRPLKAFLTPNIEQGSLVNSLQMRYTPSPSTIYKDIYKVEPGQILTFDLRTNLTLKKSYFSPVPKSLGTKKGDYKKLVQEYGVLFENAVEKQLMSDVDVGILLSGGLDSALVASIAKQRSKTAVKAFTIGFEGQHNGIDEIDYAKKTASILGLEHFCKKINLSDFLKSIEQIVNIVEEPIGTTSIIPMYFLSELAASHVKVVLSGQGADEPLGGYDKYRALPLLAKARRFVPLVSFLKLTEPIYKRNEKLRRLISAIVTSADIDSFIAFNAISSRKEITELIAPQKREIYAKALEKKENLFKQRWKERMPKSKFSNLFLYYDLRNSLADDLLMYTDKITMHFSLECRVPILDNDLICFIESLDNRYKFNSKTGKIIHKDFARECLPSTIIERKKIAFKSPTELWFRQDKDEIEKLLLNDQMFSNWFDLDAIKRLLFSHNNGKNMEKQIFLLLNIFYLLKQNSEFNFD